MTTEPNRPSERSRCFQDDLLADLREAAPMPAIGTPAPRSVIARTLPESLPVPVPTTVLARVDRPFPVIELRLTRQPWSMPGLRQRPGAPGLELCVGPVRLSLSFLPA